MKSRFIIIFLLFLTGCATISPKESEMIELKSTGVLLCKFLPYKPYAPNPSITMVYLNCSKAPESNEPQTQKGDIST